MASSWARTSSMGCWGAERRVSRSRTAPLWNKTTASPPGKEWTLQTSDDTWKVHAIIPDCMIHQVSQFSTTTPCLREWSFRSKGISTCRVRCVQNTHHKILSKHTLAWKVTREKSWIAMFILTVALKALSKSISSSFQILITLKTNHKQFLWQYLKTFLNLETTLMTK